MAEGIGQTDYKFVIVLNEKIGIGIALNTACHMSACLVAKSGDIQKSQMHFVDYLDADANLHPVSALSLIVLSARNSNQIRLARNEAKAKGIFCVDFTESMTKETFAEQMKRTGELKEEQLEYYGIGLFGRKEDLGLVTKKFSLYK